MSVLFFIQFGNQVFALKGNGLLPSCMEPTTVYATINSASVHIINFVNPLQFSVHLCVILSGKDSKHFFLLHKKSNHIFLHCGGTVDIPVMFAPEKMYTHEVIVTIIANTTSDNSESDNLMEHSLHWEYPIYGQPELRLSSNDDAPIISCRAKQRLEQLIEITLLESLRSSSKVYFKRPGITFVYLMLIFIYFN